MKPVAVIGMGLSADDFTKKHWELIESADILVGGARHLSGLSKLTARKITIDRNLSDVLNLVREAMGKARIVVLASGDPLFYGIGAYLGRCLGKENVAVYPNVSSVAAAFARIGEPWHDARVLSFHGRPIPENLHETLAGEEKIAFLTDLRNTPAAVAQRLVSCGLTDFRICVLERMGGPDEKIGWYAADDVAGKEFTDPNVMILKRVEKNGEEAFPAAGDTNIRKLYAGSPEEWFAHERGLITKAEVRAVTLSKLRLDSGSILWDLGAGSGSVSVEAGLQIRSGRIIAVEKNKDRVALIRENRERFGVTNLEIVHVELPEGLEALKKPDRVFIGGGGRDLASIIAKAGALMNPGGIMVVNTVVMQSMDAAVRALTDLGYAPEVVQLQVNRGHAMPYGQMLKAQNPVWIISGSKAA